MAMTRQEYEEKRRRLEADAADTKKTYIRAKSVYEGVCEELRDLRIDWNEQQRNQPATGQHAAATVDDGLDRLFRRLGPPTDPTPEQ